MKLFFIGNYEPYQLSWWKGLEYIGTYEVKAAVHFHPVFEYAPLQNGRFEFRHDAYSTTRTCDRHTLVIYDFRKSDVDRYLIKIAKLSWYIGSDIPTIDNIYNLRHYGELLEQRCNEI